ncbi:hypothetical protein ICM05_00120 [Leucobacter sp. cx-42]|nr:MULTISPECIES: YchJ family metal-binding protein [unclassified Leucobacter]MBC9953052.1 hypothetical protein [Leucobacter sp. cx-42]
MVESSAPESALRCPCRSGAVYANCCEPIHLGAVEAPTAERLMRSRYSAFALGLAPYLLRSWHHETRPASLDLDADVKWLGLVIEETVAGGPFDAEGIVEFTAIGRDSGGRFEQRERSRFSRVAARWVYVDGVGA